MFGLTIISSSEYEELIADRETLGDRVRFLESKLSNADNALKAVEKKLENILIKYEQSKSALISTEEKEAKRILELQQEIARSHEANTTLEQSLDQAQESVANLQKAIAEVKQQLSDSQAWAKELVKQNQNHINTIAKFVAQCDEVEKERNELIVEKGILRASFDNYQRSVAIAADNFQIEVQKLLPVEARHE